MNDEVNHAKFFSDWYLEPTYTYKFPPEISKFTKIGQEGSTGGRGYARARKIPFRKRILEQRFTLSEINK